MFTNICYRTNLWSCIKTCYKFSNSQISLKSTSKLTIIHYMDGAIFKHRLGRADIIMANFRVIVTALQDSAYSLGWYSFLSACKGIVIQTTVYHVYCMWIEPVDSCVTSSRPKLVQWASILSKWQRPWLTYLQYLHHNGFEFEFYLCSYVTC